ncbi:4'-phosphopantetheinyl transferase family protein [Frigoriglobus tundricola]|uniref:4'-phosphopantetheinyl transferase family protein n=1 Tax=Frigoriglobus tundricola TaxID=2774151 RepID=UPI00148EE539|nr:4'-phosphopantetheinyl transferase superfamily protein [Frigoriglobus tundricola]
MRVERCPTAFARRPHPDEVFAWVVDLCRPPVHPDELFRRLTPDEQARALRYKIAKAREQFVIGRGLLRGLLADHLGIDPVAVPLDYLPSGKPVLTQRAVQLHFNVTHTDGILVLAAGHRRVGVDVERVRPMPDADGLVGRYFSPAEAAAFRALPECHREAGFFRGWTCKEAVIKAAGATVGCLADFDVELHPERPPRVNAVRDPQLAGPGWALVEWVTAERVAVALAVEGEPELRVTRGDLDVE